MSKRVAQTGRKPERVACQTSPNGTTRAFLARGDRPDSRLRCYFCGQNHIASGCTGITDVKESKKLWITSKRCFQCLKTGHIYSKLQKMWWKISSSSYMQEGDKRS